MKHQIFMRPEERAIFLSRHEFFMDQVKVRVFGNFNNIEEESDKAEEQEFERICATPYYGVDDDASVIADAAWDKGFKFYILLNDMKRQITLASLASLYHQWEKDFRGFIEKELSQHSYNVKVKNCCRHSNIEKFFDVLEEGDWPVRKKTWYPQINVCRLIINVYKHGKGPSFDILARDHPQYFKMPHLGTPDLSKFYLTPTDEYLSVSDAEFDEIAGIFKKFWEEFPERLTLDLK